MSKISEKLKAVATAVAAIEKQFGRGAVMQLGGDAVEQKVPVIPSGSVGLDKAFGIGGYPRGRAVEIFGNESSGKTTLALHAIAQVQAQGGVAAFMDAEGNIFLKDRLKELIIRGGSNVYPAEIERVLRLDDRVRDAAVVGLPDDRLGERVVAFVELAEGAQDAGLEADLKALCRRELAVYKTPDRWVFVREMPRNSMNKILKARLKEAHR